MTPRGVTGHHPATFCGTQTLPPSFSPLGWGRPKPRLPGTGSAPRDLPSWHALARVSEHCGSPNCYPLLFSFHQFYLYSFSRARYKLGTRATACHPAPGGNTQINVSGPPRKWSKTAPHWQAMARTAGPLDGPDRDRGPLASSLAATAPPRARCDTLRHCGIMRLTQCKYLHSPPD